MIDIYQLALVFQSAIACGIAAAILIKLLPCFLVDEFRQKMFAVRDELFDYAASGEIAFEHPAYRLLRQSMNGFIQFGHRLTLFRLCLTIWEWRIQGDTPELKSLGRDERASVDD